MAMNLSHLSSHIQQLAADRPGVWRGSSLPGGASVYWKRCSNGWRLCLARTGKPLGKVELVTFCQHCGVPADAQREPSEPDKQLERGAGPDAIHYVLYAWHDLSGEAGSS